MAVSVMNWVFKHSRSKNGARLVMLAIADACPRVDGTGAHPSVPYLMSVTNLSERGVQDGVKSAAALGELAVSKNTGPGGTNEYTIIMTPAESAPPQNLHPADPTPPQNPPKTPAESAVGGADSAPGTNYEPRDEPSPPTGERARAHAREYPTGPQTASPDGLSHIDDGDGFKLTDAMRRWATATYPTLDPDWETAQFIRHHRSMGSRRKSWPDAWQKWLGDSRQRQVRDQERAAARASPAVRRSTTDERVAQAQALKAKLRAVPPHPDDQPPHTIPGVVA